MLRVTIARPALAVAVALAAAALSGCGNLTAGGFGEAHVVASGDAPDPAGSPQPISGGPLAAEGEEGEGEEAEGELEMSFRLYLRDADGSEVPLSANELHADLDLSGEVEAGREAHRPAGHGGRDRRGAARPQRRHVAGPGERPAQSALSTAIGSVADARRAGSQLAITATRTSRVTTLAYTVGSVGSTWERS